MLPHCPAVLSFFQRCSLLLSFVQINDDDDDIHTFIVILQPTGWIKTICKCHKTERMLKKCKNGFKIIIVASMELLTCY